jgi:hypothetical protein
LFIFMVAPRLGVLCLSDVRPDRRCGPAEPRKAEFGLHLPQQSTVVTVGYVSDNAA